MMIIITIIAFIILILSIREYILTRRVYKMTLVMSETIDGFKQDMIEQIDEYFKMVIQPEVESNVQKIEDIIIRVSSLEVENEK